MLRNGNLGLKMEVSRAAHNIPNMHMEVTPPPPRGGGGLDLGRIWYRITKSYTKDTKINSEKYS